ncbi:MAG: sulfite exporter TauE/SafE family protein [Flavobacteriales bacterium]|nr:sulfite exporter TauE/SafE family protein [Flavobacteriales bacterium]
MEWQQTIIIALIGIAAGLLSGIMGLGGAIIIIPALVMLLGFSQQMAQGTALLMMVMPVGALAAWQYYKEGNVDMRSALILGVTFFVSGFIGAKFANQIPQDILKKTFAVFLVLIAIKMFFFEKSLN